MTGLGLADVDEGSGGLWVLSKVCPCISDELFDCVSFFSSWLAVEGNLEGVVKPGEVARLGFFNNSLGKDSGSFDKGRVIQEIEGCDGGV